MTIYESIKDLEIRISTVFNFLNNTILLFFFFFFYIRFILINASMIAKIVIPKVELVIPTGTQTNKANSEIETQPVIAESRTGKC